MYFFFFNYTSVIITLLILPIFFNDLFAGYNLDQLEKVSPVHQSYNSGSLCVKILRRLMILYTLRYKNLPPKHQYINHSHYVQSSRRLWTVAWDYMPPNILTLKLSCKFEFPCKSFMNLFNDTIEIFMFIYSTFFVAALLFNISET